MSAEFLQQLEGIIDQRIAAGDESSYTRRLVDKGLKKIAQKVGEEGVETALAAVTGDEGELVDEAADLLFHLLVLLRVKNLALEQVTTRLQERHTASQN
jgi:phosphoribosyl-ATP pyrophosphohydrolase/phosphoribosyl-AMP cyclohydrolase